MKQLLLWTARHLFILATGFTALLHSTWTLATLFNGMEPSVSWDWLAWVIPAFAFALTIDVGQIVTAVEIRNGERTAMKYATFAILAIATYYLQWWYIAAHMPLVVLSKGISDSYLSAAIPLRDFAVWLVPGMLPVSTFLYTFSFAKFKPIRFTKQPTHSDLKIEMPTVPLKSSDPSRLIPDRSISGTGETMIETAVKLLMERPELNDLSLTELERKYPAMSRSTWNRAKKRKNGR